MDVNYFATNAQINYLTIQIGGWKGNDTNNYFREAAQREHSRRTDGYHHTDCMHMGSLL